MKDKEGFGIEITGARIGKIRGHRILKYGQNFSIMLKNTFKYKNMFVHADCSIIINNEYLGTFRIPPNSIITVERCPKSKERFVADFDNKKNIMTAIFMPGFLKKPDPYIRSDPFASPLIYANTDISSELVGYVKSNYSDKYATNYTISGKVPIQEFREVEKLDYNCIGSPVKIYTFIEIEQNDSIIDNKVYEVV